MPLTVQGVGVVELTARIKVTDVRLEGGDAPAVELHTLYRVQLSYSKGPTSHEDFSGPHAAS